MSKISIAAIAPYEGLQNSMKVAAGHFSDFVDADIIAGNLDECVRYMHLFSVKKYDIIISRGGTAEYLHKTTTIPVIEVEISAYDMLHAIKAAEQLSDDFIIIGFPQIVGIAKLIKEILKYSYEIIEISSEAEAKTVLQNIRHQNPQRFIIGDTVTVQLAMQFGLPNHLIASGRDSVEKAFRDSIAYFNNLSGLRLDRDVFHSVLDQADLSIIVYNTDHQLYYHNLTGHKNDYFSLFDYTSSCIEKLKETGELNLIKKQAPHVFQVRGKVLQLGEKLFYLFYIHFMPCKICHDSFFSIEESIGDFKILQARTSLVKKLDKILSQLRRRRVPVYLCGEFGSDADSVAKYMHQQVSGSQNSMISINCRHLNIKNWNALIEDGSSPLNALNYSIYFKDIHLLSDEMQLAVNNYISDTALTNRCLLLSSSSPQMEVLLENGSFLESLYHKFNSIQLRIPNISEYPEEIPLLSQIYIKTFNESMGKEIIGFDPQAIEILKNQTFPHNLHQLEQTIKQLMLSCEGFYISENDVLQTLYSNEQRNDPPTIVDYSKTLEEIEADIIHRVLLEENMNQTKAAQRLGISRSTLWRKLKMD